MLYFVCAQMRVHEGTFGDMPRFTPGRGGSVTCMFYAWLLDKISGRVYLKVEVSINCECNVALKVIIITKFGLFVKFYVSL